MNDSLERLIAAVADATGPLSWLIVGFAALAGCICMAVGLAAVARRAETGASGGSWAGPLAWMVTGLLLWSFPTVVETLSASLFRAGDVPPAHAIFSWAPNVVSTFADGVASDTLVAIVRVLQLFGLIAIVRGILICNAAMQPAMGASRSLGAGLTHVVGGVLAVQLPRVADVIDTMLA